MVVPDVVSDLPWKKGKMSRRAATADEVLARFHTRYVADGNGCWQWIFTINRYGYGEMRIGQRGSVSACRYAYETLVGPIPTGLTIDHLCRNTRCVNPAHLEPVTLAENSSRAARNREPRPTCPHGHALVGENVYVRRDRGHRECRTCKNARRREYASRNRAPR